MFSGELVGYAMSKRMTTPRVMQALFWAVAAKRPENGLLHHSDRGSQYCAHAYQKLLRQFGMQASMSRKGNCWDNAPMESFWGALKTELVHHRRFSTREQAQREITEYIMSNLLHLWDWTQIPSATQFRQTVGDGHEIDSASIPPSGIASLFFYRLAELPAQIDQSCRAARITDEDRALLERLIHHALARIKALET